MFMGLCALIGIDRGLLLWDTTLVLEGLNIIDGGSAVCPALGSRW